MNLNEIENEIERLENSETTYDTCYKLAALYAVRDRMGRKTTRKAEYSFARSEFINAVNDAPLDGVLDILDEHMECIKILHGKEYSAIIRKIKEL